MTRALKRIRDGLAKATPGPWKAAGFAGLDRYAFYLLADFYDEDGRRHMDNVTGRSVHCDDAWLIQELRNNAEALVELAEAWRDLRHAQEKSLDLSGRRAALARGDAALKLLDPDYSD